MARPMPLPAPVTSAVSRAGSNGVLNRLISLSKAGMGGTIAHRSVARQIGPGTIAEQPAGR
ncbi:hypothetical protein TM233_23280 [Bradyrhizobium sp. TM233]|nr:hypothetical protein TM233_23280 [Bradyrhizobium sp. TM233]